MPEIGTKCICLLCTCGRHKCPHVNPDILKMGYEPCKLSEYRENFATIGAGGTPSKSYKPIQTYEPNKEQFQSQSTHSTDFRSWPIEKSQSFKPQFAYSSPDAKFDAETIHQRDYTFKTGEPTISFKPRPVDGYRPSEMPFDAMTTNRNAYTPKQTLKQNVPLRPRSSKDILKYGHDQGLNAESTHRSDYTAKDSVEMPKSYRPVNGEYKPSEPFQAQSTHNSDYRPWDAVRQQPIRPRSSRHFATEGNFQGNSDYADNFKNHPIESVRSYKPVQSHRSNENNGLDGTSSYRDDYVNQPIEAAKSFKPEPKVQGTSGSFNDSTVYREDFVKQRIATVCPAQLALSGGGIYKLVHTDDKGHRWYQIVGLERPQDEKVSHIIPPIETT